MYYLRSDDVKVRLSLAPRLAISHVYSSESICHSKIISKERTWIAQSCKQKALNELVSILTNTEKTVKPMYKPTTFSNLGGQIVKNFCKKKERICYLALFCL